MGTEISKSIGELFIRINLGRYIPCIKIRGFLKYIDNPKFLVNNSYVTNYNLEDGSVVSSA